MKICYEMFLPLLKLQIVTVTCSRPPMYIHKMIVISSCYYSRISLKYCVWVICAENSKFQTVVNISGHFLEAAEVPCSLRHLVQ